MERLIKETLQEAAEQRELPPDAWSRQRRALLAAQAAKASLQSRSKRSRRAAQWVEGALAAAVLIAVVAGLAYFRSISSPPTPAEDQPDPLRVEAPVQSQEYTARVILELPLGESPEQPGWSPGGSGGLEPQGPQSMAVDPNGEIYLLDQVNRRVLQYRDGQLIHVIPVPWVGAWSQGLLVHDGQLFLVSNNLEYAFDRDGRILVVRRTDGPSLYPLPTAAANRAGYVGEMDVVIGDHRYQRVEKDLGGRPVHYRRLDDQGREVFWAAAPIGQAEGRALESPFETREVHINPTGGLYTLSWSLYGSSKQVLIHEILPPVGSLPIEGLEIAAVEPEFLGLKVPSRAALTMPDGQVRLIEDPVFLQNLWQHLSLANQVEVQDPFHTEEPYLLSLTWSDGTERELVLYAYIARFGTTWFHNTDTAFAMLKPQP